MCGLRMRPGADKLAPAKIRSKEWWMMKRKYVFPTIIEHIPEASDTSGWEIAADAVVVPVEADLQEYRRMYVPKFARKAIGFPSWLFQLEQKGRTISAQDMREVLREKLGIDQFTIHRDNMIKAYIKIEQKDL